MLYKASWEVFLTPRGTFTTGEHVREKSCVHFRFRFFALPLPPNLVLRFIIVKNNNNKTNPDHVKALTRARKTHPTRFK